MQAVKVREEVGVWEEGEAEGKTPGKAMEEEETMTVAGWAARLGPEEEEVEAVGEGVMEALGRGEVAQAAVGWSVRLQVPAVGTAEAQMAGRAGATMAAEAETAPAAEAREEASLG